MTKKTLHWVVAAALTVALLCPPQPRIAQAMTVAKEEKMGRKFYYALRRKMPFVDDPFITGYVNRLGKMVVGLIPGNPFTYRFYVINHPVPNAFATPGGRVYIFRGLIDLAENEAELMGVICHEVAHVSLRHISNRFAKAKGLTLATLAAMLAAALVTAGGGRKAGQLGQALVVGSMAAAQTAMLSYSRRDETEADNEGYRFMITLGYDPRALSTMLLRMKRATLGLGDNIPNYLSTHPGTDDRVLHIQALLQRRPPRKKSMGRYTPVFKLVKVRSMALYHRPEEAMAKFKKRLRRESSDAMARYGLALVQSRLGRTKEAVRQFNRLIKAHPDTLVYIRGRSVAYYQAGKYQQARAGLTRLLITHPKDAQALFYLGRCYEEGGDLEAAEGAYSRLVLLMHEAPLAHYHYGLVLGRLGKEGLARYHLALAARMKGRFKNAIYHFKQAKRLLKGRTDLKSTIDDEIKKINKMLPPALREKP